MEKVSEATRFAKRGLGWTAVPVVIFGLLATVFAFSLRSGDPSRLPSALIGKPVPQTAFDPIDGLVAAGQPVPGFKSGELSNGKVSIVNFWASWCRPCVDEHPLLVQLANQEGIALYGVNYKDDAISARRFLGLHGNPFLAVGTDPKGRGAIEWGVYGMPETFVVNGRGEIAYKHVGPISPHSLEKQLLPAIEAARK
jgi:cytochrome c biogenesis protein CcmG/thiol:disulfide interchange protein DsbE